MVAAWWGSARQNQSSPRTVLTELLPLEELAGRDRAIEPGFLSSLSSLLEPLVMTRFWKLAGLGAIALTTIAAATITPTPVQAQSPEVVWMVGPSQNVEILSGEIQDMVGDRARLVMSDGSVRVIGLTQLDRTRLGLDPGDRITVALVDGRFFAQAVALGDDALAVRDGYIRLVDVNGVTVSSSDGSVSSSSSSSSSTVVTTGGTVRRTTTVQQRVVTEPVVTERVVSPAPAAPVRGMW